MPRPLHITSVHNPRVADVCALRKPRRRHATGLFVAEGRREVPRAVAAGLRVMQVWHCPELMAANDRDLLLVHERVGDQAQWYEVTPAVMQKMAYLDDPHGLLAVVEQPRWNLDTLTEGVPPALYLVAVGLAKPGNLGAMARTAAAAGASAMFIADGVVDPFNPNAIRASTGAVFTLPIFAGPSAQWIAWLRDRGVGMVAASLDGRDLFAHPPNLTGPTAIVIGAEDRGLGAAWMQSDIGQVRIPMTTGGGYDVDSLNASVAAGVLLFEAFRQRSCTTSHHPPT
jgi:TrmH family RNA methyltransferase